MLTDRAVEEILDIKKKVILGEQDMASDLQVTFFPFIGDNANHNTIDFGKKLEACLKKLGVKVIPFNEAQESLSLIKQLKMFFKYIIFYIRNNIFKGSFTKVNFRWGNRIKKGIAVIVIGEPKGKALPIDFTSSLRKNPIILIIDNPAHINNDSSFNDHIETATNIFSWNLVNLIICVDDKSWRIYSFNMSYPSFSIKENFKNNVLHSFIPKVYAPVLPPRIDEFKIFENSFNPDDDDLKTYINDLIDSGQDFDKTGLFPSPKKIKDLKFRNGFYMWLGSLLLDKRSGMSYGFLARLLPIKISKPVNILESDNKIALIAKDNLSKGFFYFNNELYIIFKLLGIDYFMEVPDVWILTSRSGSDKTKLDKYKDIIKMGLISGKMVLQTPEGVKISKDYKPSFDTKVIFAHSVAFAIFISIALFLDKNLSWAKLIKDNGRAIAHWHGYFSSEIFQKGWYKYGSSNPSVSCSALQGAIFAFRGKEFIFKDIIKNKLPYIADVHIEPHHGINISYSTLKDLSNFLLNNPSMTKLGDSFL